jgi:AraC-like DNA-binding protein
MVLSTKKNRHECSKRVTTPLTEETTICASDLPELDEEWIQLAEEVALSNVATDMVRRHKLLLQLHYGKGDNKSRPRPRHHTRKRQPNMPSAINPKDLEVRLKDKLQDEQIFLRNELTLSALAHELGVEPHHLSRFLNIYLNTTFHDLVNTFRVGFAKTMLISDPESTILDIAFASGFNSKASFNRIFKKMTGSTPKQYRQNGIGLYP